MNMDESRLLVRIDERLTGLIDRHDALIMKHGELEVRVRYLERFRNWGAGVLATLSTLLGYGAHEKF